MVVDVLGIVQDRVGSYASQVGFQPNIQPFAHGHFRRFLIGPVVHVQGHLLQLLGDFLLGLASNGFLPLLSGAGVIPHRTAGLPIGILRSVFRYGLFANGAVSVGGAAHGFLAWHVSKTSF